MFITLISPIISNYYIWNHRNCFLNFFFTCNESMYWTAGIRVYADTYWFISSGCRRRCWGSFLLSSWSTHRWDGSFIEWVCANDTQPRPSNIAAGHAGGGTETFIIHIMWLDLDNCSLSLYTIVLYILIIHVRYALCSDIV